VDRYPVRVEARPDESLSRWLWLVKWLLLIPHNLALLVLWTGLVIVTMLAYLSGRSSPASTPSWWPTPTDPPESRWTPWALFRCPT